MKKFLTVLLLTLSAISVSAKEFDSVFSTFRKVEGADYVKIPDLLVRMGAAKINQLSGVPESEIPMKYKVTGLRVLDMSECNGYKSEFIKAVNAAAKNCELMLEAKDGDGKVSIWLEPNGDIQYSKMIILDEEDPTLIELSGIFSPNNAL